jgi:hypothetical protein
VFPCPPRTSPWGGWQDLIAELQELGYTAESAPHAERTHFSRQLGGWVGGIKIFKANLLWDSIFVKARARQREKSNTKHFKNLKRPNI